MIRRHCFDIADDIMVLIFFPFQDKEQEQSSEDVDVNRESNTFFNCLIAK